MSSSVKRTVTSSIKDRLAPLKILRDDGLSKVKIVYEDSPSLNDPLDDPNLVQVLPEENNNLDLSILQPKKLDGNVAVIQKWNEVSTIEGMILAKLRAKENEKERNPFLKTKVIENIVSKITCGKTLKSCRLVCKAWLYKLPYPVNDFVTLKNFSHIIQPYPEGYGYSPKLHAFPCPFFVPPITRLRLSGENFMENKLAVEDFFKVRGGHIKYLSFEASLLSKDNVEFISNVLFIWCPNLVELELTGVENARFVADTTGINWGSKQLGIKQFKIVERRLAVKTNGKNRRQAKFLGRKNDGGIIKLIMASCPALEKLEIDVGFKNHDLSLKHLCVTENEGRSLKELELRRGVVSCVDLGRIEFGKFPLKKLVLDKIGLTVSRHDLQSLFREVGNTLEYLELGWIDLAPGEDRKELSCSVWMLKKLKSLIIGQACRIRIENLFYLHRHLEELVVKCCSGYNCGEGPASDIGLNWNSCVADQIYNLKKLKLSPCDLITIDHARIMAGNRCDGFLTKVNIECFLSEIDDCMKFYLVGKRLEAFTMHVFKETSAVTAPEMFELNSLSIPKSLKKLKIRNFSGTEIVIRWWKLWHVIGEPGRQLDFVELNGCLIYDDEAAEIANVLANNVTLTRFVNCTIVSKDSVLPSYDSRSEVSDSESDLEPSIHLDELDLHAANLQSMLDEVFHDFPAMT